LKLLLQKVEPRNLSLLTVTQYPLRLIISFASGIRAVGGWVFFLCHKFMCIIAGLYVIDALWCGVLKEKVVINTVSP
jgi:hypothetical protein